MSGGPSAKEGPWLAAQKPTQRSRATAAGRARAEDDAQRIERITHSLGAAQSDLASIDGSVGPGVRGLRRDVSKLLRNAVETCRRCAGRFSGILTDVRRI
jgi:hypothetical protein